MNEKQNLGIQSFLKFTQLVHKFQQTKRAIYAAGEDRKENDAEHSYQVALTAWYLNDSYGLNLDTEKILKYAIAHDFLELYTGDFYFDIGDKDKAQKLSAEEMALENLRKEVAEFPELIQIIQDYDNKVDQESKFVNAVEKFIPVMNIYLDNGRTWQEEKMTYERIITNKDPRIGISPVPDALWKEFKPILAECGFFFTGEE